MKVFYASVSVEFHFYVYFSLVTVITVNSELTLWSKDCSFASYRTSLSIHSAPLMEIRRLITVFARADTDLRSKAFTAADFNKISGY